MSGPSRLAAGGRIDRAAPVAFTFDGRHYEGFAGDTLASALLAQGVRVMGRSFKYHRARGVLGAGVEEPNALVGVGEQGRYEPNTRATDLFVYDGLTAVSQNRWPNLAFDLGAVNQLIAPFIPAGFYYKTFLGGPKLWRVYEHFIRRAAGLGRPPSAPDVDAFDHRAAFADVVVVGSGPAGLAAARAAVSAGARVMLVEQDALPGGVLLRDPTEIEGRDGADWARETVDLVAAGGGRVLTRATAAGYHDHDLLTVVERLAEPGGAPAGGVAQRLWSVRAAQVILAQGAVERPLLFAGNDRPGVMLAAAARTYAGRFAVRPGARAVIAGGGDDVYFTAHVLADAGVDIAAVLDSRDAASGDLVDRARARFACHLEATPLAAHGSRGVSRLVAQAGGRSLSFDCDLVAMSGGQTPSVHLHMQAGGALSWDEAAGAFNPVDPRQNQRSAGAGAGVHGLNAVLADGWRAGVAAAAALGLGRPDESAGPRGVGSAPDCAAAAPPPHMIRTKTAFVDFQNDVTAADIDLAWREGYRSVEHLKRYTTLGMATDQGKTSNIVGLTRMAGALDKTPPQAGLTTFRPPYTPVTLGALAGGQVGWRAAPERRITLHAQQSTAGADWIPSGYWRRARAFPRPGEGLAAAALREARAVRDAVGLTDVSTLGKFEIAGPDAAALLEIVCATRVANLAVGRGRYTVMLREDGLVADDGTVWRLDEARYMLTSSTGGAEAMAMRLSYARRVLAPHLRAAVASTQDRWTGVALAGPRARELLHALTGEAPPAHMGLARGEVAGVSVLVLAASYSGERAFEIYAPSLRAGEVWAALAAGVAGAGGGLYGLDAMDLLRIEKGHVVTGAEIDGRTSPGDLGLGRMIRKGGYLGWAGLQRPDFARADRMRLVGLEAVEGVLPEGAMVLTRTGAEPEGHVTSAGRRVLGEGAIGLGLVRAGPDRLGETMLVSSPTRGLSGRARLVEPLFHDKEGNLYRDV